MNNRDEVISLGISKSDYSKMADKASPNSPKLLNAVKAFLFGGGICLLGQLLNTLFESIGLGERQVRLATPAVLIVATAVLTGIGVFDKIARQAGAGTIVPITGFANAVVSPALEFQHEGFVLGTAAQNVLHCRAGAGVRCDYLRTVRPDPLCFFICIKGAG